MINRYTIISTEIYILRINFEALNPKLNIRLAPKTKKSRSKNKKINDLEKDEFRKEITAMRS